MIKPFICIPFAVFSFVLSAQDYAVNQIPAPLKEKANVVIRKSLEKFDIKAFDQIEFTTLNAVTIFKENGVPAGFISLPADKYSKPGKIKVTIYNADGKAIKTYSKKDFRELSGGGNGMLYTDDKFLLLTPQNANFPYTVEAEYSYTTQNTVFLPDFTPFSSFNTSLEKAELQINNTSGVSLRSKVTDSFVAKVQHSKSGTTETYTYENVPALEDEDMAPDLERLLPRVQFALDKFSLKGKAGEIADWDSFGKWYYQDLLIPASQATEQLKQEVADLNLNGSTEDKVKKLYQYMQDKTRYIAVAIGIGGWQPMDANEVSKKGYGDCKALTNYMRTLLDIAGIKSYYAIINNDRNIVNFDADFPKMGGNHVVLMIPTEDGNAIWLENTSQNMAFNHLGRSTTSRNVLAVDENGIKIFDTPTYGPDENKSVLKAEISLSENGQIQGKTNFRLTGWQYDSYLGLEKLPEKDAAESLRNRFRDLNYQTSEVANVNNNRDEAYMSFDFDFTADHYTKNLGGDLLFRSIPFIEIGSLVKDEKRSLPFESGVSFADDYEITYKLPAGYRAVELPPDYSVSTEFGDYSLTAKTTDSGAIRVHRKILIKKGDFPKEKYENYIQFRKKIVNGDHSKILISKI